MKRIRTYLHAARTLLRTHAITVFVFLVFVILGDILFVKESFDGITFSVLFLYVIFAQIANFSYKTTFGLCLGLFGLMFVQFLFLGPAVPTEKSAVLCLHKS